MPVSIFAMLVAVVQLQDFRNLVYRQCAIDILFVGKNEKGGTSQPFLLQDLQEFIPTQLETICVGGINDPD